MGDGAARVDPRHDGSSLQVDHPGIRSPKSPVTRRARPDRKNLLSRNGETCRHGEILVHGENPSVDEYLIRGCFLCGRIVERQRGQDGKNADDYESRRHTIFPFNFVCHACFARRPENGGRGESRATCGVFSVPETMPVSVGSGIRRASLPQVRAAPVMCE